jgi:hypothetical protein
MRSRSRGPRRAAASASPRSAPRSKRWSDHVHHNRRPPRRGSTAHRGPDSSIDATDMDREPVGWLSSFFGGSPPIRPDLNDRHHLGERTPRNGSVYHPRLESICKNSGVSSTAKAVRALHRLVITAHRSFDPDMQAFVMDTDDYPSEMLAEAVLGQPDSGTPVRSGEVRLSA